MPHLDQTQASVLYIRAQLHQLATALQRTDQSAADVISAAPIKTRGGILQLAERRHQLQRLLTETYAHERDVDALEREISEIWQMNPSATSEARVRLRHNLETAEDSLADLTRRVRNAITDVTADECAMTVSHGED